MRGGRSPRSRLRIEDVTWVVRPQVSTGDLDGQGHEWSRGISAGAIAKELAVSPAVVKRALADLKIDADFVKAGCGYYYPERMIQVKSTLK